MITQAVTVKDKSAENITIGRRGTYETEEVVFDLSYLIAAYGEGTAVLMVKRPSDNTAYPVLTEREGVTLIRTVSEIDTAYKGHGECELFWYVGENALAKSVIYSIAILRDIGETTETPPDPYQTWVDELTALGEETLHNAQEAAQSAEDANTAKVAAETAQGKAETAQEKAEIAQGKAETAQGKAEDAQEAAEIAVTHYPKIVNSYWYVWQNGQWVNTGVKAEGVDGREIVSVSCEKTGTSGLVDTYTMTITYNSGNPDTVQFLVTNGEDGYNPVVTITTITGGHRVTITDKTHPDGQSFDVTDGIDGISPDVTITTITGGHRITITDAEHPLGQSFDVMDGTNTDAEHVTYDDMASYSDDTVGKAVSDLNSAINTKADVIVDSVSSAPVAYISDGADNMTIRELNVSFVPQQDLHGYSAPWPPGGGKNKYDQETYPIENGYYINATNGLGAAGSAYAFTRSFVPCSHLQGKTMTLNKTLTGVNPGIAFYTSDDSSTYISGVANSQIASGNPFTFTVPSTANYMRFTVLASAPTKVQIEEGPVITTYEPYGNVCTIYGHTGVTVEQTGANLLDGITFLTGYYWNASGIKSSSENMQYEEELIPVKANSAYLLTFTSPNTSNKARIQEYDASGTFVSLLLENSPVVGSNSFAFTTSSNAAFIHVSMNKNATNLSVVNVTAYQISWQDEAGTVYGGKLTVNEDGSGRLIVDWVSKMIGSVTYSRNTALTGIDRFYATFDDANFNVSSAVGVTNAISSIFDHDSLIHANDNFRTWVMCAQATTIYFYVPLGLYYDHGAFETAMANEQIVYNLATPLTYTLTAEQVGAVIRTFYGQNNFWASSGDISLDYRADTKKYIDKKLAELVAQIVNS